MSRVHQKDVKHVEPPATESDESPGKVVVDSRGHSVWQWAKDVLENTSVLLKRLENKDLALEPTQKVPVLPDGEKGAKPDAKGAGSKTSKRADSNAKAAKDAASKSTNWHPAIQPDHGGDRGGGFDPYNSR
jgi:hypothetical protein